ncbi:MAG TPA: 2OG-Fe(II) oxygenase family protein [Rhizomicrobium sp.]|nr:2OG-Fe(II) oxygenase family protein [Rhizomicrobium sp.]
MGNPVEFQIAPQHDASQLAAAFRARGRMHIPGFLREEDARAIHDALLKRTPWNLTVQRNGSRDITPQQWEALSAEERARVGQEVIEGARQGFQGRYCTLRLSDEGEAFAGAIPELAAATALLNSPSFLDFARKLTNAPDIDFADAQATLYRPGDFLTEHDDWNNSRKRVAAYVLNLTPQWTADWGGNLCFLDGADRPIEAFAPAWNALNIFTVPQQHYVSFVAPYAGAGRYSITGWLRAR